MAHQDDAAARDAAAPDARRQPLTRARLLAGAMAVADADGIAGLTMRSLAQSLGVRPMALYHHVANKDEILDGVVDAVFAEIYVPSTEGDWRTELRRRSVSARSVLRRHPWATPLMESRMNAGPATLRHHDAVLGTLRGAGFSLEQTAHAYALLDSHLYGSSLQESGLPFDSPDDVPALAEAFLAHFPAPSFPHLAEFTTRHVLQPGYDYGTEFEFGLDVILDAVARLRDRADGREDQA
ncbi:TetR/AcrR family transcriptional regulator [Cellulomonas fimi]|uniref:TetR/AcrR family transcriptional regulator n=1 Tax=Cellulomonas fimi TaxID=1708 RepID=A0A7Y0M1Y3_CELFI|nr:TetR/AcrR family transcriptional regulator [Cellulomonas fimi]NMR20947.1 TetR/AcrR family transcriptional regulator [Cellulomonas fimi]